MLRLWRMLAPLLVAVITLAVMLSLFATATLTIATGRDDPSAPAAAPQQQSLPEQRAEMYRSVLLKALRSDYNAMPPRTETVLQNMRAKLGRNTSEAEVQVAAQHYTAGLNSNKRKIDSGNPLAYLGRLKAQEMASVAGQESTPALSGNPEVLTVMLNFT